MRKLILIISLLLGLISFGQEMKLNRIDAMVKSIESDSNLILMEFDWEILAGITSGSKGIRKTWTKGRNIYKIVEEVKYYEFTTRTTIFMENRMPIKIIEKEENFEYFEDRLDYSKSKEVFSAVIYIFNWENDESKIIRNGTRVFTKGSCSIFDYESLLENTRTE